MIMHSMRGAFSHSFLLSQSNILKQTWPILLKKQKNIRSRKKEVLITQASVRCGEIFHEPKMSKYLAICMRNECDK